MQIINEIKSNLFFNGSSVALGFFDGVHLGHREIIKNAVNYAKKNGLTSVVATFSNHPHAEITGQAPKQITTFEEKKELIRELGVDVIFALEFNSKLRHMLAYDYFSKVLIDSLNARFISIGYDHKFGFKQEGNPDKLKEWGKKYNIVIHVNDPVNINDEPVSSSRIRKDIAAGKVKIVSSLLGRNYSIIGKVVEGLKRGTTLGFPTANLVFPFNTIIPGSGVYACYATLVNKNSPIYKGLVNIGYCPTFKDTHELKVEAHLLDFNYRELYGEEIQIGFVDKLRDEYKFNSQEELILQITKDSQKGREILI